MIKLMSFSTIAGASSSSSSPRRRGNRMMALYSATRLVVPNEQTWAGVGGGSLLVRARIKRE